MKNKNIFIATLIVLFAITKSNAQEGFGTSTPAPSSVVDIVATNKGVLLPRVALTATNVSGPITSPAQYLTVFNTATAGTSPNNVTPGYYYWSNTAWIRMASANDIDLRAVGINNHITVDAGNGGTGTNAGTGGNNILMGIQSGNAIVDGADNVGIGRFALQNITSANNNVAVGTQALRANTGTSNTAVGAAAATSNTSGTRLVAIGERALNSNTTGDDNTAVGSSALRTNTTGTRNLAIGRNAMNLNTIGNNNVALGSYALAGNTTADFNVAVGNGAAENNTTGTDNIAVGYQAANKNTTGAGTVALGYRAAYNNTTGLANIAIGHEAFNANTTGSENIVIGKLGLNANTTANYNIALGTETLFANTTGSNNVAIGYKSLNNNITGANNTVLGHAAGTNLTSGSSNIFIGSSVQPNISTTGSNQLNIGNWIYGDNGKIGIAVADPQATLHLGKSPLTTNEAVTTMDDYELILYSGGVGSPNVYQPSRTAGFSVRNSGTGQGSNEQNMGLHAPYRFEFFDAQGTTPYVSIQPGTGGTGATYPGGISDSGVGINTQTGEIKAALHVIKNASQLTPAIIEGCNVYADNAAATTAGVPVGGLYRTATGQLMVRF